VPSFLKFEDVTAAVQAGLDLSAAYDALNADLAPKLNGPGSIHAKTDSVITGSDEYSKSFKDQYDKPAGDLVDKTTQFTKDVAEFGPNVSKAASTLMYVDIANGTALAKSTAKRV
jgi:hypothetical protein